MATSPGGVKPKDGIGGYGDKGRLLGTPRERRGKSREKERMKLRMGGIVSGETLSSNRGRRGEEILQKTTY